MAIIRERDKKRLIREVAEAEESLVEARDELEEAQSVFEEAEIYLYKKEQALEELQKKEEAPEEPLRKHSLYRPYNEKRLEHFGFKAAEH